MGCKCHEALVLNRPSDRGSAPPSISTQAPKWVRPTRSRAPNASFGEWGWPSYHVEINTKAAETRAGRRRGPLRRRLDGPTG